MPRRPKLLFLCQTLPFPPDGGVHIRTYNVMRLLARSFDITALCFYRRATRQDENAVERGLDGLREFADVEAFPIPQESSLLRLLFDHARSVATGRVYTYYAYRSAAFENRLEHVLREHTFDLVHVDSLDLSGYLPAVRSLPIVCTHHNVESALLLRRAKTETSLLRRGYLRLQGRLMRKEEERWCSRVSLNAAVSDNDAQALQSIAPRSKVFVVPNGVDTSFFTPGSTSEREDTLVFVGGYSWYPNRDAMQYFADEVLPLVKRDHPRITVRWVGRAPTAADAFRRKGVELTGYVDDIRPYVQEATCYIAPLRVGGGTRLKILDAWAMGKAVVTTSIACEGLAAEHEQNVLIADTPQQFATAIHRLIADPQLRSRLGERARRTAETEYDWEVVGRRMLRQYLDCIHPANSSDYLTV